MNVKLLSLSIVFIISCSQKDALEPNNESAGGNSDSVQESEDRVSPSYDEPAVVGASNIKAHPITNTRFDPPPTRERPFSGRTRANQKRYMNMINKVARQRNLGPAFVHAIISRESKYNTNAMSTICRKVGVCVRNHTTAHGLMQLMPDTSRGLGLPPHMRKTHPERNVLAGTKYLAQMKWAKGNLQAMAAGYNSGPARAKALLFKNTRSKYWRGAQVSTSNGVPGKAFWKGETYHYARHVAGFYLLYKHNPALIGLTAKPYPSSRCGGC